MNETLEIILKKALELAEKTGDFAVEQSPILLQEFYIWHMWTAILGIVLALLISLVIFIIIRVIVKNLDDTSCYLYNWIQIIPIAILGINIYNLVFVLVAPRLYLIEYFLK